MTAKNADRETLRTLKGECIFLFEKLDQHDKELSEHLKKMPEKAYVISSAYLLSSIYSCYEDIFKHIARVFENRIENLSSWHSELLNRMLIDVPDIRPAVLSDKTGAILDEMRSFRHIFRNSYVFVIDADRISAIVKKWNASKQRIRQEVEEFLSKVGA